ncbi:hypothetical protein N7492_007956 [Penicillium capsulatum]|uniref:Uncharacterized protein n=1 Tax=Penicillium capsulatum TaxID=69766 RepID=A0A9W9HNS3_9EURO|nr:hypothetical protein N7492_007956 [Penicillium capsulatum]KAJ6105363.1 hypothetical protein N7512_008880 [Penicillium capsulatum]
MPDILIINDDASFISSSTASFDLHHGKPQVPSRHVRHQKTVRQLRRWVSKRMPRSISDDEAFARDETSAKEADTHHRPTQMAAENCDPAEQSSIPAPASGKYIPAASAGTIVEMTDDEGSEMNMDNKEIHLRLSYAAFCHRFTLSGMPETKHPFIPSADADQDQCIEQSVAVTPSALSSIPTDCLTARMSIPAQPRSLIDEGRAFISPLEPPPQVMTPSIYMEKRRAAEECKHDRRPKRLDPLRLLFVRKRSLRDGVEIE